MSTEDPEGLAVSGQTASDPTETDAGSELRELLGVAGQLIDDRLRRIEQHLGIESDNAYPERDAQAVRAQEASAIAELRRRRKPEGGNARERAKKKLESDPAMARWAHAASRTDGQPAEEPNTGTPVHRATGPDVHPEDFDQTQTH